MPEYTDEQISEMIKAATKGMYSEDDFQRALTREVDRRVESGIQKGLETQKAKWEEDAQKKAKLSAEELARSELENERNNIKLKEAEVNKKANRINAITLLTENNVQKTHYEPLLDILISDNEEETNSKINAFIASYNNTKNDTENAIKKEYTKIPAPTGGSGSPISGEMTKEEFQKLKYSEKVAFKTEFPEKYKAMIK